MTWTHRIDKSSNPDKNEKRSWAEYYRRPDEKKGCQGSRRQVEML
jgi:hypothetical protein